MPDAIRGATAIAGLGITPMGKIYGYDAQHFGAEAVRLAVEDAGIDRGEIDGLLINAGTAQRGALSPRFQNYLGLPNLRLLNQMNAWGATAGSMVQYAALAIHHGMASAVVCVFADAPLQKGGSAGAAYAARPKPPRGMASLLPNYGFFGANTGYALAARRYMDLYGVSQDALGGVAVAQREWAALNPQATMRDPISLADYHNSRWIVEPLHLLDCCLVSNGGVAVIVTSAERARDLKNDPAYIWGMGQGHPGNVKRAGPDPYTSSGAIIAKQTAFGMAGITTDDVAVCEFHDCYTYTVLRTIEDYGFCGPGEAATSWRTAAPGRWIVAGQYRRRAALRLLHVGHDAARRGRHPGARFRRRAPGRKARRRPHQRQWRHAGDPRHPGPQPAPELSQP